MSLDFQDVSQHLVGVIDLKNGRAVHAVAGQRDSYCGVVLGDGTPCDDPVRLAKLYHDLGIKQLYIADLDGIVDGHIQQDCLKRLLDDGPAWERVLLDAGCGQDEAAIGFAAKIQDHFPTCNFIVASEAASSPAVITEMAKAIGAERTVLGMDYRGGQFVTRSDCDESAFLNAALAAGVRQSVVLDVAAVGTDCTDAAIAACQKVKSLDPRMTIYSGGGIASATDVHALMLAGSDYCLAATWLQKSTCNGAQLT